MVSNHVKADEITQSILFIFLLPVRDHCILSVVVKLSVGMVLLVS